MTPEKKISADVLIVPAADILLVSVFFMVLAGSIIQTPAVKVSLPEIEAEALVSGDNPVVTLTVGGGVFLDGRRVSLEGLTMILELSAEISDRSGREPVLIIRADREVPYGDILKITEIAGEAGMRGAALAVRKR